MKLATFIAPGATDPVGGLLDDDGALRMFKGDTTVLDVLTGAPADTVGAPYPVDEVTLLAPLTPRAIFCIGLNYAAHAAETGGTPPERPIVFMKLSSSSAAPNGEVVLPEVAHARLDYEGELAVVMGVGGEIAGYAIADDLSARHLQGLEPQWTRAKGFDNSCPWGPWITTPDEAGDPHGLLLRTWVDGDLRQESSTDDLIFDVPKIVAFIAEAITLEPGDLILTGTPSGVGMAMDPAQFLQRGQTVRIEIERLGAIEHTIA